MMLLSLYAFDAAAASYAAMLLCHTLMLPLRHAEAKRA